MGVRGPERLRAGQGLWALCDREANGECEDFGFWKERRNFGPGLVTVRAPPRKKRFCSAPLRGALARGGGGGARYLVECSLWAPPSA